MSHDEERFLRDHRAHDIKHLLTRWRKVAQRAGLIVEELTVAGGYPVLGLKNRRAPEGPGYYFSSGIHGDEAGSVLGLLTWAEENVEILKARPVTIFPCVNPWGLVHNLRVDPEGRDLNRSFERRFGDPICAMIDFIADRRFAIAVSLHEDYDAQGAYLYELARRGDYWGDDLLGRLDGLMPRHRGAIEGRRAENGVVRRTRGMEDIARMIDGMPEAIYLFLHHARTALTFETPSEFSLYQRVSAHVRILEGVVERVEASSA